jgi:ribA/ribD-fused uncharacterized protein
MNYVLFHSRAKCNVGKYLSNFYPCTVLFMGKKFDSVENAFQAAKFTLTNKPEYFEKISNKSATDAKKLGSKGGMKKLGALLEVNEWNESKDEIMQSLLISRYMNNPKFKETIDELNNNKIQLCHFERSGPNAYWGGCFNKSKTEFLGYNKLGKIMMDLNNTIASREL